MASDDHILRDLEILERALIKKARLFAGLAGDTQVRSFCWETANASRRVLQEIRGLGLDLQPVEPFNLQHPGSRQVAHPGGSPFAGRSPAPAGDDPDGKHRIPGSAGIARPEGDDRGMRAMLGDDRI
ncbi:MAG: hypothetical protein HYY09_01955 [Firmicutes bacterium]|nr:hypothetical protein [Bacillota bacterium]